MEIIKIDPRTCTRWKYADRNSFEFGDINLLAEDIKRNGQVTPIHVRPIENNSQFKYEVIAGSRRLQACLTAGINIDAIVVQISDTEAATIQIKENEKIALSEYSKGIFYAKLKTDGKLNQEQLAEIVGCSRRKMQSYLSFAKIDQDIWTAVNNMSRVSARAADTILAISKKSTAHKKAIIDIAEEIRKGAGTRRIEKLAHEIMNIKELQPDQLLTLPSGQIIGSWKKNSFVFSENLPFNKEEMTNVLIDFFQNRLKRH
jgi:ParB family chromosome partitioning protein